MIRKIPLLLNILRVTVTVLLSSPLEDAPLPFSYAVIVNVVLCEVNLVTGI
jgi:hypothetical protein